MDKIIVYEDEKWQFYFRPDGKDLYLFAKWYKTHSKWYKYHTKTIPVDNLRIYGMLKMKYDEK
jgi:hypothetical protein